MTTILDGICTLPDCCVIATHSAVLDMKALPIICSLCFFMSLVISPELRPLQNARCIYRTHLASSIHLYGLCSPCWLAMTTCIETFDVDKQALL